MRLLVTGAAGFIGSAFVRTVLAGRAGAFVDGCDITAIDKLTYAGSVSNLPTGEPRLTFVHGDICDRRLLSDLLPGHDMVVHFAAETHVDRSIQIAEPFAMTNVVGTQVLLECCRDAGISRFIHISTDEVYGSIDHGASTEESPLLPSSPYAASKASSDLIVRAFYHTFGLPAIVTRCANTYGPYQFPEKLIPRFITDLLDDANVPLYGDGLHVRDWIHVEDHCKAILLVLESGQPGAVYNIGGETTMTNRDLTARLLRLCGATWDRVIQVSDRKGHDRRYALDDSKIKRELGYLPSISFEQGLADTVRWYQENRKWWESKSWRQPNPAGQAA